MKRLPKLSGLMCTMLLALAALAVMATAPMPATAQGGGCGGSLGGAPTSSGPFFVGNTVTIRYTLGVTASGGTTNTQTITEFDFKLDCANAGAFGSCTQETSTPLPISWAGGLSVAATTCRDDTDTLVTWSTTHDATPNPNQVTLTPSNPVVLPNAGSCTIDLDVLVNGPGDDLTPDFITQAASFAGQCDSGATGGAIGSDFFNIAACGVQLDKQVSCDYSYWNGQGHPENATWHDVGYGDSGADGCTGYAGDTIAFRYKAQATTDSVNLNNCTITDVKDGTTTEVVGPVSAGSIATSTPYESPAPITTDASDNPLTCDSTHSDLEPNTATISCACAGAPAGTPPATDSDTATFSCETCDATIDKQVGCRGTTYDIPCTAPDTPPGCDPLGSDGEGTQTQSTSCIAYDSYCSDGSIPGAGDTCPAGTTLVPADQVAVNYTINSTGQDSLNCTATDTNGLIVGGTAVTTEIPGAISQDLTAAGGANDTLGPLTFNPYCSGALSSGEPDTATLNCTCDPLNNNTTVKTITKNDTARFSCQQPQLMLTKTCDYNSSTGADDVSVTATNNSPTVNLVNCTVTDQYLETTPPGTTDVMCPQTLPLTAGTGQDLQSVTLGASPTSGFGLLANGGNVSWTGTVSNLTADACNNASITCDIEGTSPAVTVSANAQDTCEVPTLGCETRTPGFWKTHPDTTQAVIDANSGQIMSCGLYLTNTDAGNDCSAIEDMCSLGRDAHNLGIDPVQANLIFQCAAAELNLAVTQQDGGSCGNTIPGSALTFDTCCGFTPGTPPVGVCATADTSMLNACQNAVSNFNSLFDNTTLTSTSVLSNPGANPSICQAANGNGFVNDSGGLSGPSADCGGSRTYLLKTTGGGPGPASTTNNGKALGKNK